MYDSTTSRGLDCSLGAKRSSPIFAANFGGATLRLSVDIRASRNDAFCLSAMQILEQCLQLSGLEFRHIDTAPTPRARIASTQPFAEGVRDHLGAPTLLAKQPVEQAGGLRRLAMRQGAASMRDVSIEVIEETAHCSGADAFALGVPKIRLYDHPDD